MQTLAKRLAEYKAGKRNKPFTTSANYSSRWGGAVFPIGENVGYRHTFGRWHESPETPFRFIGLAHKIINLKHTGWFTRHDEYDETARGVVYALPHGRFLAAIADECNAGKDGRGPCIVEVDLKGNPLIYEDKEAAARSADQFAECYAEGCREFDRIESEKLRLEDSIRENESTLESLRDDARSLLVEIRESKLSVGLCERMKRELRTMRAEMHRAFSAITNDKKQLAVL